MSNLELVSACKVPSIFHTKVSKFSSTASKIRTEGLIISSLTIVFPELKKELASVETVTTESPLKLSSIFN